MGPVPLGFLVGFKCAHLEAFVDDLACRVGFRSKSLVSKEETPLAGRRPISGFIPRRMRTPHSKDSWLLASQVFRIQLVLRIYLDEQTKFY
jgi:hypothetical protein